VKAYVLQWLQWPNRIGGAGKGKSRTITDIGKTR